MTPQEAQTLALQWIAVVLAVVLALISAGFTIWNAIQTALAKQQAQQNTARLDRHGDSIKELLRDAPPKNINDAPKEDSK